MNLHQNDSKLLRLSLKGNAIFSFTSGLIFTFAHVPIATFIGLGQPAIVLIIGLSLLAFALGLFISANRAKPNQFEAKLAVILDLAWVFASILIVALGLLSRGGSWGVIIIADIVLAFAALQFLGLRRVASAG